MSVLGHVDELCHGPLPGFTDIDQQLLSKLFYQYLNVEEDFVRELFTRGETQLGCSTCWDQY